MSVLYCHTGVVSEWLGLIAYHVTIIVWYYNKQVHDCLIIAFLKKNIPTYGKPSLHQGSTVFVCVVVLYVFVGGTC